jgi:hypothetical protein
MCINDSIGSYSYIPAAYIYIHTYIHPSTHTKYHRDFLFVYPLSLSLFPPITTLKILIDRKNLFST